MYIYSSMYIYSNNNIYIVCIYVQDCIVYNIQLLREQMTYFFLRLSLNKF